MKKPAVIAISWNYPAGMRHFAKAEILALAEKGHLSKLLTSKFRVYDGDFKLIADHSRIMNLCLKLLTMFRRNILRKPESKVARERLFDRWASWHMGGATVAYFDKNNFPRSIEKAKRRGLKTIVFQPMAHNGYTRRLLEDDRKRFDFDTRLFDDDLYGYRLKGLKAADVIIAHSRIVVHSDLEMGMKNSHTHISYGCVDSDSYTPSANGLFRDRNRLLFVGHELLKKGFFYLMEAWELLQGDPSLELWIVGRVPEDIVNRFSHLQQLRFLGHISEDKVIETYRQCSALILPAIIDAGPKVVLEAMASGLPVIVSNTIGYSELMENGKQGYIINARSSEEIVAAVNQLFSDEQRLLRMSTEARELAKAVSPEKHGNTVAEIIARYL